MKKEQKRKLEPLLKITETIETETAGHLVTFLKG